MSERARFTSFHRLNSRINRRKQPTIDWFITSKRYYQSPKECNQIILETGAYLETIPTKKERDEHMKKVEKEIWNTYKPRMKKLTFTQGKLLIKLIDRECNSTSYELVQAFLGPVRAGFYQAFAWAFGSSLKKRIRPQRALTDSLSALSCRLRLDSYNPISLLFWFKKIQNKTLKRLKTKGVELL